MIALLSGLLVRTGLPARAAGALSWVLLIGLALFALWWMRTDAYADGVRDTDDKWKAASAEVEKQAAVSTAKADSAAEVRAVEHVQQVEREKEQIDEAVRIGSSPFDVLFGGNGM